MAKINIKPVLPSLREKKRYLAFEVISREKIEDGTAVSKAVKHYALQFMGMLETAKAGIMVLGNKWDSKLQRGIAKVGHRHVDALKASLMLATDIGGKDVIFRSLGVSGALKKAEMKFMKAA